MGIGRPVGSTNDKSWRAALTRAVNRRVNGRGSPKKLDMIADKCADEAMNGEAWAVREVGDRLDGKPAQAIAIKGDPDSPVVFNLRLGDGLAHPRPSMVALLRCWPRMPSRPRRWT